MSKISRDADKPSINKILHSIWRPTDIGLPEFADETNKAMYDEL